MYHFVAKKLLTMKLEVLFQPLVVPASSDKMVGNCHSLFLSASHTSLTLCASENAKLL